MAIDLFELEAAMLAEQEQLKSEQEEAAKSELELVFDRLIEGEVVELATALDRSGVESLRTRLKRIAKRRNITRTIAIKNGSVWLEERKAGGLFAI